MLALKRDAKLNSIDQYLKPKRKREKYVESSGYGYQVLFNAISSLMLKVSYQD